MIAVWSLLMLVAMYIVFLLEHVDVGVDVCRVGLAVVDIGCDVYYVGVGVADVGGDVYDFVW